MENKPTQIKSTSISIGSIENKISQAKNSKTIQYCEVKEISKMLVYLYTLCGFEKMPDKVQDLVLINYIRNHYYKLTLDEIKLSFELGISGETQAEMKHYHNFSALYFSSIVNTYLKRKIEVLKQIPVIQKTITITESEKQRRHKVWLNDLVIPGIKNFYKTGEPVEDMANTIYNYLRKANIINFTKERKAAIWAQAKKAVIQRYEVLKSRERGEAIRFCEIIKDLEADSKDTRMQVQDKAKSMAFQEFMDDCKEINRNLTSEIKAIEKI